MSELVERLRDMRTPLAVQAADEIDRLKHDIERHVEIAAGLATDNEKLRLQLVTVAAERDQLRASRDHHRNKKGVVKIARNRAIDGMDYWRDRAMEAVTHIYHLLDYIDLHQEPCMFDTKEIVAAREFYNEPTEAALTDDHGAEK